MEEQERPYNEVANQMNVHSMNQQANLAASQTRQLQYAMEDSEKNLAEAQLDCQDTLDRINHLLNQDVLEINQESKVLEWMPIVEEKKKVLTVEGVRKIMQTMQSYINKETLLSNFDEKTIARRMLEFSLALSALLFMKYEIYFRQPTLDECEEVLQQRIDEKIKRKEMSLRIYDKEIDSKEIKRKVLAEIEGGIEYEIKKIKEERTRNNLKEFEMMFNQLKHLVEATHNRAWKGEERGSLRRHFNISEVIGGGQSMEKKKSFLGFGG